MEPQSFFEPHDGSAMTFTASAGASRKSGRRGEAAVESGVAPPPALPPPPPLTPFPGATAAPVATGASALGHGGWWEASLPPRGYTAARRTAEPQPIASPAPFSSQHSGQQSPPASQPRQRKRRRTEQVTYASLYKEVCMYLDAVAATQQNSVAAPRADGGAEEDARATGQDRGGGGVNSLHRHNVGSVPGDRSPWRSGGAAASAGVGRCPSVTSAPSVTAAAAPAALAMPVAAAVLDTLRVLRNCWDFCGAPQDAFEPVRLLSPITVHLLTAYGHHTLTHNGEYVVLRGGPEQLPWVGGLYGILLSYAHRRDDGGGSPSPAAAAAGFVFGQPGAVSRVALLNCHSFGWLDHVGSDEYERSHRRLYQAREALTSLLEDARYTEVGRRLPCPLCSATMHGGDGSTAVLLGDTIVMEGGAPSLGLAAARDTFTAHYQYGRGIACCVTEPRAAAGPAQSRREGGGEGSFGRLCARHSGGVQPGGGLRWSPAQPAPSFSVDDEEGSLLGAPRRRPALSSFVPPPAVDASHLSAVCCGTCRAAGVLGQALLLGPTGPLLIHLQFEQREWLEAAAPLLSATASGSGGWGWAAQMAVETPAVCPAPPLGAVSFSADPATALAAVLYAQMQRCEMPQTAAPRALRGAAPSLTPPSTPVSAVPFSAVPHGGAVSLAEFVEWLVRLLHAPPPALVVEWHAGPAYASWTADDERTSSGSGQRLPRRGGAVPSQGVQRSPDGSASTSPHPEYVGVEGEATARLSASSASTGLPQPPHPTVPLGMCVRPRQAVVPQLLETYADVMLSRQEQLAADPDSQSSQGSAVDGRGPAPQSLTDVLMHAAARTEAQDTVLLGWVLAAREALRPCEATAYFDGVERPLVLAKGLEVVAEGERYVTANSVATSLQFRPCASGAWEHEEPTL